MSLLVYNLTAAPLTLNNGPLGTPLTTIPASTAGAGLRGVPYYASGNELNGLDPMAYAAVEAQRVAGDVAFEWQAFPEYLTGTLFVDVFLNQPVLGPQITAALTIAPTTTLAHVTGVTAIHNITPPYSNFVGDITLIADDVGGFTTDTGGNIARGTTAVFNVALKMTFDGTMWYPSYI